MALALPGIISQFSKRNIIGDQVAGLQGEFLDSLFPDGYIKIIKYELQSTEYFDKLLAKVRDATAKKRLLAATSRARHKILPRPERYCTIWRNKTWL